MTAYNLYPNFVDRVGYVGWRKAWKSTYLELSEQVRQSKQRVRQLQRSGEAAKFQKELLYQRAVARKMMTLLDEAKLRRDRILGMHKEIAEQGFPIDLGPCKNIDFHFNRGHNEFPFLPMWALRIKGKSYYVDEVQADVPWTTRERASGSTKGVIRFSRGSVAIDANGIAKISSSLHQNS